MTIVTKQIYMVDGKPFDTLAEAQAYENELTLAKHLGSALLFTHGSSSAEEVAEWMHENYLLVPKLPSDSNRPGEEAVEWLNLAIAKAKEWRGNHMPEEFPEFDADIQAMKDALKYLAAMAGVRYEPT